MGFLYIKLPSKPKLGLNGSRVVEISRLIEGSKYREKAKKELSGWESNPGPERSYILETFLGVTNQ
jgi:hypothetical protein